MAYLVALLAALTQGQVNTLTTQEAAAGYDLLFNGANLDSWHGYRMGTAVPDAWFIRTNTPLGPRIENGNGNKQYLMSNKKYMNFDLKIDVQTPVGGNSGIFVRYEEVATSPFNQRSGPELQICGPNHSDCASPKTKFGVCYDMFPVDAALRDTWYNPPGSWNQLRIVAFDSNYVHYGNGKKLLEYKIGTQEFLAAYAASKYVSDGNNGRYYHIHPGSIMLQHHGEIGITFRNIKAKELTTHPFRREFQDGKWPATLAQDFVFGATTGVRTPFGGNSLPEIKAAPGESGNALLTVDGPHSAFEVFGLDGKRVPFRKTSDGTYLLERGSPSPEVVLVRIRAGGKLLAKKIFLP